MLTRKQRELLVMSSVGGGFSANLLCGASPAEPVATADSLYLSGLKNAVVGFAVNIA